MKAMFLIIIEIFSDIKVENQQISNEKEGFDNQYWNYLMQMHSL